MKLDVLRSALQCERVVSFFKNGGAFEMQISKGLVLKCLALLAMEVIILYCGLFAWIVAMLTAKRFYEVLAFIITFGFIILVPCALFLKRRKRVFSVFGAFLLLCIGCSGIREYVEYRDSLIPVLSDGVDIQKYRPFSDNLPRIQNGASLKIKEDIPVLDGALALYPLYSAFATALYPPKNYSIPRYGKYAGNEHEVHFTNTIAAFEGLLDGKVDIYFMADISEGQKKLAAEKGVNLRYTPLGKEAFVFFVNNNNPINNLTVDNIKGIYSGEIKNWSALGWKGEIKAFQRHKDSGSQTALERLMGNTPIMAPPENEKPAGMGGIIRNVADYKNYENAIGFSFRYFTNTMAKNNMIKLISINGIPPTRENIESGAYPFTVNFYAITNADNKNPNVEAMLKWFGSEEGQYLVKQMF